MIDRSSGDFGRILRSPDLRLGDIHTEIIRGPVPFTHLVEKQDRGMMVYLLKGNLQLDFLGSDHPPIMIKEGSAVGFESGRAHRWTADSLPASGLADQDEIELFISTIPRSMGVLQQLDNGMIILPPEVEPYATIFHHCVAIHMAEHANPARGQDESIIRRAAEICLMQFVRYAQARLIEQPNVPTGLAHDEYLLRAWNAFYADPQRRWTVRAWAQAAGLGRSAFSERFTRVFGAPPLQTLTRLKLQQAETMLKHSHAPLIEIAFTVGYNSEAAFVRAFHRLFAMPPGKYRAAHQADR